MEPCPMCFVTMVMMNIKNLKYGARDNYAGATDIYENQYYVKQKTLHITHEGGDLEVYQLVLQSAYEYQNGNCLTQVIQAWRKVNDKAVSLGKELFEEGYISEIINHDLSVNVLYDEILQRYYQK